MENKEDKMLLKQYKDPIPHALNINQIQSLISSLEKESDLLKRIIVLIFLFTGIRMNELLFLKKDDVLYYNEMYILRIHSTREISRYVPLNYYVYQALSKYLNGRIDGNEYLFVTKKGEKINIRQVQAVLFNYKVNSIQLRQTFRKELIRINLKMSVIVGYINGNDSNESSIESLDSLYQDCNLRSESYLDVNRPLL
jgi:site-specific recombinase XerD